jgi:hypothetical protein
VQRTVGWTGSSPLNGTTLQVKSPLPDHYGTFTERQPSLTTSLRGRDINKTDAKAQGESRTGVTSRPSDTLSRKDFPKLGGSGIAG